MPAVTRYGVDVEVALGLGRYAEWGVWDSGTWGVNVWADPDTGLGEWVDVTCEVLDGLSLQAGADDTDGVVTRWEAATCVFTLLGDNWDPWGGPYAGRLAPQLPVRVRWRPTTGRVAGRVAGLGLDARADPDGWVHAFEGTVDDEGWNWEPAPPGYLGRAGVMATDYTSDLTAWDPPDQDVLVGDGETAAERVARILDLVDWPVERQDVTAGGATMAPTLLGGEAWAMLLDVADADLALLWVRRDGVLTYIPQGRVAVGTELAGRLTVCPAGPDDIQVADMSRAQPHVVRNRVAVSRAARDDIEGDTPTLVVLDDPSSIGRFRTHGWTRTDLGHDDDDWTPIIAEAVLAAHAWPSPAPGQVVVGSDLGDDRVAPLLLSLEPSHWFDVVDTAGVTWHMAVAGWDVDVTHGAITGTLTLTDVSAWVPSALWDTGRWDVDRWAIGGPT